MAIKLVYNEKIRSCRMRQSIKSSEKHVLLFMTCFHGPENDKRKKLVFVCLCVCFYVCQHKSSILCHSTELDLMPKQG